MNFNLPSEVDALDSAPAGPPKPAGMPPDTPNEDGGGSDDMQAKVNYTSAGERCSTCVHFDSKGMQCKLHKFAAEPEGHCDTWEPGGTGDEEPDTEPDADMDDGSGLGGVDALDSELEG